MFIKIFLSVLILLVILLIINRISLIRKIKIFENREKAMQSCMEDAFHELKTPLAAIKVLADSLLSQEDAKADIAIYKEFMKDISIEADRENKIISDLMQLVKLEKPERELEITEFSVNELSKDIIKLLAPIAGQRNIKIVLEALHEVKLCSDRGKVSDIIMNLVENAVKYNIEDGWIKINLSDEQEKCCIKVSDSGIGIPKEEQGKIFERFYRVNKQYSREIGGTGLGLSIVLSAAEMLGGTAELESSTEKGSTFMVKIPTIFYSPK